MNKFIVALTAALAVVAFYQATKNTKSVTTLTSLEAGLAHQNWMLSQGKVYSSPAEQAFRLGVFHKRLETIRAHNSDSTNTWEMGLNQFSDLTDEEFAAKYLGDKDEIDAAMIEGAEEHQFLDGFTAPSEVSHVKYVPKVLNQQSCGSCWAFGTAASAEVNYNKATGKNLTFSPQQLLDCSGAGDCNGGIHPTAVKYYEGTAPALNDDYPYQGKKSSC